MADILEKLELVTRAEYGASYVSLEVKPTSEGKWYVITRAGQREFLSRGYASREQALKRELAVARARLDEKRLRLVYRELEMRQAWCKSAP